MGKYTSLNDDIYSVFASPAWTAEAITTVPENYDGSQRGTEYVRVAIIAPGAIVVNPPRSVSGILMLDIFVPAGLGVKRLNTIADKLDAYLAGKSFQTGVAGITQLSVSALTIPGVDPANPSLYRGIYSLPFTYFGN